MRDSGMADSVPLIKISPALDLILTRPVDPAHSEYGGQSKQLHELLVETILSAAGSRSYAITLRRFPFPPSWPRLQSPLHHLKSYSLSDHARWSCIIPGLLRCWLQETHVQPHFFRAIQNTGGDPISTIVKAFAAVARSNSMTMSNFAAKDRAVFGSIVKDARTQYQELLRVSSLAAEANPASSRVGSRAGTPFTAAAGPFQLTGGSSQFTARGVSSLRTKKGIKYVGDQRRPNVHTGSHLEAMMKNMA
jgi:hypothetical protein